MGLMDLYNALIMLGVVFCQSDFKVLLFGIFPGYIVAGVLIHHKLALNHEIKVQQLPPEYRYLFP